MPDIIKGELGSEAAYDVSFSQGALQLTLNYKGTQANLSVTGSISAAQLLAALAEKVTNPTEKLLLQGLESIIAAIP